MDHPLVKKPAFSYESEVKRKCNNEKLFMRTKEQHEKEKALLADLKKLDQRIKKEEKEERNFRKLVYKAEAFKIDHGQQASAPDEEAKSAKPAVTIGGSGAYLRSQIFTAPLPTKKENLQKKFEIVLSDIGVDP